MYSCVDIVCIHVRLLYICMCGFCVYSCVVIVCIHMLLLYVFMCCYCIVGGVNG